MKPPAVRFSRKSGRTGRNLQGQSTNNMMVRNLNLPPRPKGKLTATGRTQTNSMIQFSAGKKDEVSRDVAVGGPQAQPFNPYIDQTTPYQV